MLESLLIRDKPSPFEWAQTALSMPVKTSPSRPGPLRFAGQEFLREPLEALRDDAVSHITLAFGAQVAKTTYNMVAWAYMRAFEPAPALWALPTKEIARMFVRERFRPFLDANPWLIAGVPRESLGSLGFQFADSNLSFVGVNNPGELSSRPVSFVVMDEAAKFEHRKKAEASPDTLIEDRTISFLRKKILSTSTPSTEDHPFWQRFLHSDQRHYFMPCPHCSEPFEFKFTRQDVTWQQPEEGKVDLDTVRRTARIVCPHCGGQIDEPARRAMIPRGQWLPLNPAAASAERGYHLNSLYSCFLTLGDVAVEFVKASRSREGVFAMQNFVNSYLAEPFTVYSVRVREETVEKLRSPEYKRGELPAHFHYLAIAYDCHQREQWWAVCAIGDAGEQWVIDWGSILSIADIPAHAASLEYDGHGVQIGFVDAGYATDAVYDACQASGGLLYPSKGTDARFGTFTTYDIPSHPGLELTMYSDHQAKTSLYGNRIDAQRGAPLHVPRDADETLMRGLSGQELAKRAGARHPVWKPVSGDHLGDCVKLCALTWQIVGRNFAPVSDNAGAMVENSSPEDDET